MNRSALTTAWVAVAIGLTGCASSPPPPPPPKPPTLANEMARAMLRQGLNEVQMMTIGEAQRKSEEIDLGCLSAGQRAEFKQREQQAMSGIARESLERMMLAMQRSTPQAHRQRVAAQYALDRCEAELPANMEKGSACPAERAERAKWGPEPSSQQETPGDTMDSLTRMAKARAAIRVEYPACEGQKPTQ